MLRKFWLQGVAPIAFAPMEGEGTGGDGDGGGEVKRPDYIPEKFWDPEKKAPRVEQLAKSYGELETKFKTRDRELEPEIRKKVESERFAKRPAKADDYVVPDVTKFEDVKIPDGVKVEAIKDHPLMGFWRQHAWETGLDQAQFDAGVKTFLKSELDGMGAVDTAMKELGEGDAGKARVRRVDAFISDHLESDDDYQAIAGMLRTSKQVVAFERLMKKLGKEPDMSKWSGRKMADGSGGDSGGAMTLEQIRAIQAKPEYWRDHDPALIKQVREGYVQLRAAGKKR